jgi:hypothetical protein
MIFSENRFPLFGIMLYEGAPDARTCRSSVCAFIRAKARADAVAIVRILLVRAHIDQCRLSDAGRGHRLADL